MSSSTVKCDETDLGLIEKANLKGDRLNFALLTLLYALQGVVLGVTSAIPFVLQKRNITYQDQAVFHIVWYSFSFKILWAPLVDSVYWRKLGRRKTWLIPTQYLIGILWLLISMNVDNWLGSEDGIQQPKIPLLTAMFFLCVFFTSTQDIAVDGWSLTIFQRKNIGYSGPSQSLGFSIGFFLSFVGFIMLDSKDFCNIFRSVPQDFGFVKFADFIFFWSLVFVVTTTLILFFKKESDGHDMEDSNDHKLGIRKTYSYLWKILSIRRMQIVGLFLFTWHIGFGPLKTVGSLKLLDAGIPRDVLALFTVPSLPFQFILPVLLRRHLTGPRPMRVFLLFYLLKLINGTVYATLIFFITRAKIIHKILPTWYYWPLVFTFNFDGLTDFVMSMSFTAMAARISDPRFGGVYLTLFNCLGNVGRQSVSTVCLWMVDFLTIRSCVTPKLITVSSCHTIIDGFYIEVIACIFLGTLWIYWGRKQIYNLEKMDPSAFRVEEKSTIVNDDRLLSTGN